MQLFSAYDGVFSKKPKHFDPKNMRKPPSKVAPNRYPTFFIYWPSCPNGPETEMPYHQKPLDSGLSIYTGGKPKLETIKC